MLSRTAKFVSKPVQVARRNLSVGDSLVNADKSKSVNRFYHASGVALAILFPVALIGSPSPMNKPVDIALGVAFPAHAHIGMNYIISDYVPKAARGAARVSLLGVTVVTMAGLLKLNLAGDGLTEVLKSFWRKKKE